MAPDKKNKQTVPSNKNGVQPASPSQGKLLQYCIQNTMQAKLFCFTSIVLFYTYYFHLQELLISDRDLNLSVSAINGIECFISIIIASIILTVNAGMSSDKSEPSVLSQLTMGDMIVGTLIFCSKYCSGFSLKFVSFPFAKLFKSAKVIPIALMGALRGLYKMTPIQYVNAFAISAGLFIFQLYKPTKKDEAYSADAIGIVLLAVSLLFDGFSQTQTDKQHKDTKRDFAYPGMLGNNVVALFFNIILYLYQVVSDGDQTHKTIMSDPKVLQNCVVFGLAGAIGQVFIFFTISLFDCYFVSIILTCQKFITIIASNLYFGHRFNTMQWVGFCIVAICGFIEIYVKKMSKKTKKE